MKNIIKIITVLILSAVMVFTVGACSCKKEHEKLLIVAPDGAPALALSNLMANKEDFGEDAGYKILANKDELVSYIPTKKADIAILPLNLATLWCGEDYKIAAVNTHGNLYFLGKGTNLDLTELVGKKMVAIQFSDVPGLTLRAVLNGKNIAFRQIDAINSPADENCVNIVNAKTPQEALGYVKQDKAEVALIPEPAVTMLSSKNEDINVVGDLQKMYRDTFNENYPQAVTIVKTSLIEKNKNLVNRILNEMEKNNDYLKEENIPYIVEAIADNMENGATASLDASKLNATSLTNSNVQFVNAISLKTSIMHYIERVIAIDSEKISTITDEIFYTK